MVKPKENQLDQQLCRQILLERLQPTASPNNRAKDNWQKTIRKDFGKFKKAASSFKGSVDSLMFKLQSSEKNYRNVSSFMYTSSGLVFEILSSEEYPIEKIKKNKSDRLVKTTSNSPFHDECSADHGSDMESLRVRLNQLELQVANGKENSNLFENNDFVTSRDAITFQSSISSNTSNNSQNQSLNGSNENMNVTRDSFQGVLKVKAYSNTNKQLPENFSRDYSEKCFSCPLHGLSISQGRFKAFLPLYAFPQGHICLKVRGYRLEIVHIIKSAQNSSGSKNSRKKSISFLTRINAKNNVPDEPICLNTTLNDYSYSNLSKNFNSQSKSCQACQSSVYFNHSKNCDACTHKTRSDNSSKNGFKEHAREDCCKSKSDKNEGSNAKESLKKHKSTTSMKISSFSNRKMSATGSLNSSLYDTTASQTCHPCSSPPFHAEKVCTHNTPSDIKKLPNSMKEPSYSCAESPLSGNDEDRLIAYNFLGNVSLPIFVEPSSLDFDVRGQWMVLTARTKLCISSNCLNLEDDDDFPPKFM